MFTTQEEARTKWCPFARTFDRPANAPKVHYGWPDPGEDSDEIAGGTNRISHGRPDSWCLCIASDCMMWRWHMENHATGSCGLARVPT